jgi:hypothetical protein
VHICCPPGHGCNSPDQAESCALEVLAAVADELEEAAEALARWRTFERACELRTNKRERRFRRRAYERVRDRVLIAVSLRNGAQVIPSQDAQVVPSQDLVARAPRQGVRRMPPAPTRGRATSGTRSPSAVSWRRVRAGIFRAP